MMFSGMVPSPGFQSRFFVLANENRTQDAGHALLRQGRNPKVRKNSGVIGFRDRPVRSLGDFHPFVHQQISQEFSEYRIHIENR
jgi:hypothetical protein